MTESELATLESTFGVTLPETYRQFALRLLPPEEEQRWECADVVELIRENQSLRDDGWYGVPWPKNLFCIGAHDGNHFFIDLDDPSRGVFYANHEEEFNPEDFSALRVGSLEEYCNEGDEPSPPPALEPFASAWVAGMSKGALTVTQLADFSLESMEAEVRRLDGFKHVEVSLSRSPVFMPLVPADLTISGGPRGYFIEAMADDDTFLFFDPSASPKPLKIFSMDPGFELPGHSICRDLNVVIAALRHFYETGGELLPTIEWIRHVKPEGK